MLSLSQQIKEQKLVCPKTRQVLLVNGSELISIDGRQAYPMLGDVPVLLADTRLRDGYLAENNSSMIKEYRGSERPQSWRQKFHSFVSQDYRSKESIAAFTKAIAEQPPNALCLSIGGGPSRAHGNLVNLNIDAFPNVDVVADAYALPYADDSVDAVHCEAVLEHLEFPERAVSEIWRVLKPMGQVLAATPFLQWFHGYPNHFQNFTLVGHERLFTRVGFTVIKSGSCVGPTYAILTLLKCYIGLYMPFRVVRVFMNMLTSIFFTCIYPLDKLINKSQRAHILASTTFVHASKSVMETSLMPTDVSSDKF